MRFDLKKLTHALAVERLGSFSLAADELGLTQPTLSRSISSLESAWSVRLFERGRTGIKATSVGREMLKEAAQLVADALTLDYNMKLRGKAESGSIAFGMSGLIGAVVMGEVLARLSKASPNLKVIGRIETLQDLISDVCSDRIEFAVFADTVKPSVEMLTFDQLGHIPVSFIVRAGHPLAERKDVQWEDIGQFPIGCSASLRDPVLPHEPTIICDNYGAARDLMLMSDTVLVSSPWALRSELNSGRAHELSVLGDKRSTQSYVWIGRPNNRLDSPAAARIISYLNNIILELDQRDHQP